MFIKAKRRMEDATTDSAGYWYDAWCSKEPMMMT
jgi:hypothetical protein